MRETAVTINVRQMAALVVNNDVEPLTGDVHLTAACIHTHTRTLSALQSCRHAHPPTHGHAATQSPCHPFTSASMRAAMHSMSTEFGVDSSSRFPFLSADTDRQTQSQQISVSPRCSDSSLLLSVHIHQGHLLVYYIARYCGESPMQPFRYNTGV